MYFRGTTPSSKTARDCAVPRDNCIKIAHAIMDDPVSGSRLQKICDALIELGKNRPRKSIEEIMGSAVDARKLLSSLTLFERTSYDRSFSYTAYRLLSMFYGDERCEETREAVEEIEDEYEMELYREEDKRYHINYEEEHLQAASSIENITTKKPSPTTLMVNVQASAITPPASIVMEKEAKINNKPAAPPPRRSKRLQKNETDKEA